MTKFSTTNDLIAAYVTDHNSRCNHTDKHFTAEEVNTYHVTTILKLSMFIKYGIQIAKNQTTIIHGFGYVEA